MFNWPIINDFLRNPHFSEKNAYFQYMLAWFDAQLDQKICEGIYFGSFAVSSLALWMFEVCM